ncbi:uracil-DNA glycosylase [Sulfurimonas aquatica]|uniref:Uracil-DNA glycosylase n=1 Tax=Sulfurimonas aquatica TaxID=2672570 RepID=A0A975GD39_9BACT|nr:uracil-DNA glycosylase [Sulfurimonas aquatica]QSZ42336.1 uracil-DNA glycosylase [Sulfurimonas aquatica]
MFLNNDWISFLDNELKKDYFVDMCSFIDKEYKDKTIYPKYENIFRAFNLLSPLKVKVVIIGQDPYHGINQANGLAFSVSSKSKIPPSLKNIYKELIDDIGCSVPNDGDLTKWSNEGVLLINSVLSVVAGEANSHRGIGWEIFTDTVIERLSDKFENIVFILWGGPSQKKELLIDTTKHLVLKSPHPSPLSAYRGFFGSKPFSQTNKYLQSHGITEIDWCLSSQQTLL